ncbi:uncharacterized protein LOC108933263 [Scleropages formosus]|uniref:uncharacterized protein LOC108933263 n=1 Tax=Scleropages formosus TaxID=113540 RepID=UPI0010FAA699|nr:uncharacterized protein LOC108933263 [Scleropages formosus]
MVSSFSVDVFSSRGSARLVILLTFANANPLLNESGVSSAANAFLDPRLTASNSSQRLQGYAYKELPNSSFVVNFTFLMENVSISQSDQIMNATYNHIQDTIEALMNQMLNSQTATPVVFPRANFTVTGSQVEADVNYVVRRGTVSNPSPYLSEMLRITGPDVTTTAATAGTTALTLTTTISTTATSPATTRFQISIGSVLISIRLVFLTIMPSPSESNVLSVAHNLFNLKLRALESPQMVQNITYEKLSNYSFALKFVFAINNVNISQNNQIMNSTYIQIQDSINILLNKILNNATANPFVFPPANFTLIMMNNQIQANVKYVFKEGDISNPSPFLSGIIAVSGLSVTTTTTPILLLTTPLGNVTTAGSSAWILGFIIPCGIIIILLPFWILLCCLLTGWCAAIRRRWHRRRSYNVQYRIHNNFF